MWVVSSAATNIFYWSNQASGKKEQERVRYIFGFSNAEVIEFVPPLVTGRAANQWCFEGQDLGGKEIFYRLNDKVWMK